MSIVVPSSILRHTISNDFSPVRGLHDVYSVTPHNTFRYNRNNFLPQTALGCIRNGVIRSDTNPPSPLEEPSQAPRQCIVLLGPRVRLGVAELVPHVHTAIPSGGGNRVVQNEGRDHGDRHVGREDRVHDAVELHTWRANRVRAEIVWNLAQWWVQVVFTLLFRTSSIFKSINGRIETLDRCKRCESGRALHNRRDQPTGFERPREARVFDGLKAYISIWIKRADNGSLVAKEDESLRIFVTLNPKKQLIQRSQKQSRNVDQMLRI